MASSTLCVSCFQLPLKQGSVSVKTSRCPICSADVGMTAYGAPFRILPEQTRLLTPFVYRASAGGAVLFSLALALIGFGLWTTEQVARPTRPVDPPAPYALARVPEVSLLDRFPQNINPFEAKARLTTLITEIKAQNAGPNRDAFMVARIAQRKELQGLPFIMGEACRTPQARANSFQSSVQAVRTSMAMDSRLFASQSGRDDHSGFWNTYSGQTAGQGTTQEHGIAALTQILAPERMTMRASLVQRLAQSNQPEATKAIAKAAIFDFSSDVRDLAIRALRDRKPEEYSDVLMYGIRYPMQDVANRSAVVLMSLERRDLLPGLVAFLGEAAPGDPVEATVGAQKACVVREMVRINHHRNCLMCHSPTAAGTPNEVPGVLPIPGMPFPSSPDQGYGSGQLTGEPMVRADTTYLRQDFSALMAVENASPWPELQRFDFLVRTRVVDDKELQVLQHKMNGRPADYVSDNHKAALRVLRELTGRDAGPTQAAWTRVLEEVQH